MSAFSLKAVAKTLKRELKTYRLVISDKRTPRLAKLLLGLAIGYALMPFDIIPDFIPIIGHLDDALIIPLLVIIALKMIPKEVIEGCRLRGLCIFRNPYRAFSLSWPSRLSRSGLRSLQPRGRPSPSRPPLRKSCRYFWIWSIWPWGLFFLLFRVLKHLAGGYLAERGYHGLVVGFDKMPRALEDVPRPLGSEMHEGEPARNFLQTIFDRNPCHISTTSLFQKIIIPKPRQNS